MPGMIGPAFLLLPLALLALRHPHGRKLLLAGAVYSIPAFLNIEVRFLLPALPFFALALGLAMENSWGVLPAVALFQSVLCWPLVMDSYCNRNAWRIRGFPVREALHANLGSRYIEEHVGDYALRGAIDRSVPVGHRIFSFAGRAAAYIDRDIVVGYESTQGTRIQEALQRGLPAGLLTAKSAGCDFLLINDSDSVSNELGQNISSGGLTALAKANGTTLFRVE